jgi:hypothetical protein
VAKCPEVYRKRDFREEINYLPIKRKIKPHTWPEDIEAEGINLTLNNF